MGFKNQVGDQSWAKFMPHFPTLLRERLENHHYGNYNTPTSTNIKSRPLEQMQRRLLFLIHLLYPQKNCKTGLAVIKAH